MDGDGDDDDAEGVAVGVVGVSPDVFSGKNKSIVDATDPNDAAVAVFCRTYRRFAGPCHDVHVGIVVNNINNGERNRCSVRRIIMVVVDIGCVERKLGVCVCVVESN